MKRTIISLAIACSLLGCVTSNDNYQAERTKLINAKSKWENAMTANVAGYVFTSNSSCFCPFKDPVKIIVNNDTINSIIDISTQTELSNSDYSNFSTINQWYSWIEKSLNGKPSTLTVEYDSVLGYPRNIVYDRNSQAVDDELNQINDSLTLIYRNAK